MFGRGGDAPVHVPPPPVMPDLLTFTLERIEEGEGYTLGRLMDAAGKRVCVTAERAWVDKNGDGLGDRMESRIPAGDYLCARDTHNKSSPKPYRCWEVLDVPGRSEIHIHIGNDPRKDSLGCPLVGTKYGAKGTIEGSKAAFEKLEALTKDHERIRLIVKDPIKRLV
jgi:hypothetical protein